MYSTSRSHAKSCSISVQDSNALDQPIAISFCCISLLALHGLIDGALGIPRNEFHSVGFLLCDLLDLFANSLALLRLVEHEDTCDLSESYDTEEEVDRCEPRG